MKFNWGTGIALFYCIFAGTMIFFVFKSTQYDHSLVQEDYYAADLKYQERYDKLSNSRGNQLVINNRLAEQEVALTFPAELRSIEGNALFFRPSDSKQDFSVSLQANEQNQQSISTKTLQKGLWKIKVDWSAEGKKYYQEMSLVL